MNKDKLFFRLLLYFGIILLLGFIVSGLSQILVYFNKGASKADMLKTAEYLPDGLSPQIVWLDDDANTGRLMEDYNRTLITQEYIRATHQRNLSQYTQSDAGVKEYFGLAAREHVKSQVDNAVEMDVDVEHVELYHNLKLHFYSADGQIVSFTDYAVHRKSRVRFGKREEIHYLDDVSDFLVVMQLEDGYWRIKNMERSQPTFDVVEEKTIKDTTGAAANRNVCIEQLKGAKGINYYPQNSPFQEFWVKYDSSIVEKDFKRIDSLGFNMVRIFLNYEQFGKGHIVPEMLERLDHLMETASNNELKVLITLFDFNSNYHLFNFPNCDRQLEAILTRYQKHPALIAYDLKNEVDLDFKYQEEIDVREWLKFMLPKMREYDPFHPFTIGWSDPDFIANYANELDFLSFHSYANMKTIGQSLDNIKDSFPNKLVVLSEFGMSSYESIIFPFGKTQTKQALHVGSILKGLSSKGGVPFFLWTLYDYPEVSGSVAGGRPWQVGAQKQFGLYDKMGQAKEVLSVLNDQSQIEKYSFMSKIPRFIYTYIILAIIAMALFWWVLKRK
jgi:hypothetical protein